ncbi:hypothetical protein BDR05DRAFT_958231 [Suillus weaverae]|nr:hypothetical protein BDR05DRAFT_958231 [Suillus weaverae]
MIQTLTKVYPLLYSALTLICLYAAVLELGSRFIILSHSLALHKTSQNSGLY